MATGLGGEQLWLSPTVANNVNPYDDQSGQGNNGTNNGTTVVSDTSSGGTYCFDFDGVNDYVSTLFGPSSWVTTGVFSLSAWVKYDTVQDSGIVGGGVGTADAGISNVYDTFASNRGHGTVYSKGIIGSYAARSYANDLASVTAGQWYHVLSTGDGTDVQIYINGVLLGTSAIAGFSSVGWSSNLEVGCVKTGTSRIWFLDGRTDDIRAYDRTLTQSEITHLATSRGVLGPPGGATHYNPFKTHAFTNNFQQRLR